MFNIRKIQEKAIYEAIKNESDEETAKKIVLEKDESDSVWVNATMKRLEDRFDKKSVIKIRQKCQCGFGMDEKVKLVKDLMAKSSSFEEFVSFEEAKKSGLSYKNGNLYLQFNSCTCPMLANVDKLEAYSWCHCTTGYSKVLFEKAFGCNVDVELLKSIKMGDNICLMKVVPCVDIWK